MYQSPAQEFLDYAGVVYAMVYAAVVLVVVGVINVVVATAAGTGAAAVASGAVVGTGAAAVASGAVVGTGAAAVASGAVSATVNACLLHCNLCRNSYYPAWSSTGGLQSLLLLPQLHFDQVCMEMQTRKDFLEHHRAGHGHHSILAVLTFDLLS